MRRYCATLAMRLGTIPDVPLAASRNIAATSAEPPFDTMPHTAAVRRIARASRAAIQPALLGLAFLAAWPAQADANLSEASAAISLAPLALSIGAVSATGVALSAIPAGILSAGATLVVVGVEVIGGATVWVLERVSDGVRISVKAAGKLAEGVVVSTGAVVTVSVIGAGTLLSAAGEVIAFIPSEIGKALLYNEQVSR
jgi:hypothetical protein